VDAGGPEARGARERVEPRPDVGVAAATRNDRAIQLDVAVEGRAGGMAEAAAEVDVLDHRGSARAQGPPHPPEHARGLAQGRQQEGEVAGGGARPPRPGGAVAVAEGAGGGARPRRVLAGELELRRVEVEAVTPPSGPPRARELEGDVAPAAAEVEAGHPR